MPPRRQRRELGRSQLPFAWRRGRRVDQRPTQAVGEDVIEVKMQLPDDADIRLLSNVYVISTVEQSRCRERRSSRELGIGGKAGPRRRRYRAEYVQDPRPGKIDGNDNIGHRRRSRGAAGIAMIDGTARYEPHLSRRRFSRLGRRTGRGADDRKRVDRREGAGVYRNKAKQDDMQCDCIHRQQCRASPPNSTHGK